VSLQQAELAAARASLRDFAAAGFLPLRACGRATLAVQCSAAPVFVAGRYLKLDRETSQTPWFVDEVGDDDAGRAAAGGAARKPGPLEEAAAENEKVGEEEEDEEEQEQEEAEEAAGGEGKEGEERAPRRPQLTSVSDELCGRLNEALHAQSEHAQPPAREFSRLICASQASPSRRPDAKTLTCECSATAASSWPSLLSRGGWCAIPSAGCARPKRE
jgi:hypothetical protein